MTLVSTKFLGIRKFLIPVVCIYMHRVYKHTPIPVLLKKPKVNQKNQKSRYKIARQERLEKLVLFVNKNL